MHRPHPGRGRRRTAAATLFVVALLVLALLSVGAPPPAGAEVAGDYAPPVDGPVTDPFRAPANPYAAGNRGIDYETPPGAEVRAAGPGEVTFAGQVGGRLHAVLLHPDGLRTSYSYLATVTVHRGQVVGRGEPVGTSTGSVHFGVRAGERYVDPALLLASDAVEVHLVPVEDRVPGPVADERRSLRKALVGTGGVASAAAAWLVDRSAGAAVAHARRRVELPLLLVGAMADAREGLHELAADQEGCTPPDVAPPQPTGRRIAVLVAGYGSSGGAAEVLDIDTAALGFAASDVVQLSYEGGRVPGVGDVDGVATSGYGPTASMGDLDEAGERLRELLGEIATSHPGVPVAVLAHSQGGLVARAALSAPGAGANVSHLVTLGSPHHGATLATVARQLDLTAAGSGVAAGLAELTGGGVDPAAPAVAQLAAGSPFLALLARRPPARTVAVTSIAASGDLVVPGLSSVLDGATNVVVPVGGVTAHGRLPGSPEAARELALALGDAGPTCVGTVALTARAATAAAIAALEQGTGTAAGPTVRLVDDLAGALTGALTVVGG